MGKCFGKFSLWQGKAKFGLGHGLVEERVKVFISLPLKNSLTLLYLINDMVTLPYDYLTIL